jgi:hypothetical protein
MTIRLLSVVLFCTIISSAQTNAKKEILLDEYDKPISVEQFKQKIAPPLYNYVYTIFENDTAVIAKTLVRKQDGNLNLKERELIIGQLEKISGKKIDNNQTIVINYFYEEATSNRRKMIEHYTEDRQYRKFFDKNSQYQQFFIKEKHVNFNRNKVVTDTDDVIRSLLFPYPISVSYIIIWPDGKFYKQLNEYRLDEIPQKVKKN